jgi:hypothetical protein
MQKNYFKSTAFAAVAMLNVLRCLHKRNRPDPTPLKLSGGIREYMGDLGSSYGIRASVPTTKGVKLISVTT